MVNLYLKRILTLGLVTIAFNTQAFTDKELLIHRCRNLSENIMSLVSSQVRTSCVEQLNAASILIEAASAWIALDHNSSAKEELEQAIFSLQYAELNTCNQYIQISHSKFEAHKIKNMVY